MRMARWPSSPSTRHPNDSCSDRSVSGPNGNGVSSLSRRRSHSCSWPSGLTSRQQAATGVFSGSTPCSSSGPQRQPSTTRSTIESYVDSGGSGSITDAKEGASLTLRAFNDGDAESIVAGRIDVTDAFGRTVNDFRPKLQVKAHAAGSETFKQGARRRLGAFRARWKPEPGSGFIEPEPETKDGVATLTTTRLAVIEPQDAFLRTQSSVSITLIPGITSCRVPGARGWAGGATGRPSGTRSNRSRGCSTGALPMCRSAAWRTWEAMSIFCCHTLRRRGRARPVPRSWRKPPGETPICVRDCRWRLLPGTSATSAGYAAETVRHYRQFLKSSSFHDSALPLCVQILNEPVYTDYALPQQFGYSVDDYIALLRVAYQAMKNADPQVQIVGGISAGLKSAYTREFLEKGGLKWCDVVDLHIYDAARPASTYEEPFKALEDWMKAHGVRRPVWITEWGCYADDDPPNLPLSVGDASMNRCRWPSERAATEHIVKFAAIGLAHGVEKIFFHAGTVGRINGPDAGGVLFEYGGAPARCMPASPRSRSCSGEAPLRSGSLTATTCMATFSRRSTGRLTSPARINPQLRSRGRQTTRDASRSPPIAKLST